MLTRRRALQLIGSLSATSAPLPIHTPSLVTAANRLPADPRLIVILLRGGLDGLSAVPPYADPDYALLRPRLVSRTGEAAPSLVKLDDHFGLHPEMAPLKAWYDAGDMLIVHAIGLPPGLKSHFAAQHMLESGAAATEVRDGWLNRALQ
ncbi:DUF1501 domain-containing protein [Candidatus Entotheonella palauensis]|uniref:DUF1501 domain-containing protein n=1 Tax=Candidatus Entotheonella palauensis TaxID=93172 RepID=UPI000B7D71A4|nr:DUF1501 domain-containing protein [Candidatus Entotheonella palauensis]